MRLCLELATCSGVEGHWRRAGAIRYSRAEAAAVAVAVALALAVADARLVGRPGGAEERGLGGVARWKRPQIPSVRRSITGTVAPL